MYLFRFCTLRLWIRAFFSLWIHNNQSKKILKTKMAKTRAPNHSYQRVMTRDTPFAYDNVMLV